MRVCQLDSIIVSAKFPGSKQGGEVARSTEFPAFGVAGFRGAGSMLKSCFEGVAKAVCGVGMSTLQVHASCVHLFGGALWCDQIAVRRRDVHPSVIQCEVGRVRAQQCINLAWPIAAEAPTHA